MRTYLVTGAAGFIGSEIARSLIASGHRVVALDNLSTGFRDNLPAGVEFYEGACQDESLYHAIPQIPYDAIYHIAGQSSAEISFDDPVYDLQTNAQSTLLLLQFARRTASPRFLYASSMSVYGEPPQSPVGEQQPTLPKSFYAVGKLASEHYMRIYCQYGIACSALRLFNVYGPGQNWSNLRQGMVSIFLAHSLCDYISVQASQFTMPFRKSPTTPFTTSPDRARPRSASTILSMTCRPTPNPRSSSCNSRGGPRRRGSYTPAACPFMGSPPKARSVNNSQPCRSPSMRSGN